MSIKYKILKAIDVAGLNFLRPVILLCYGEEPEEQIRKIGLFIAVPIMAFCLFLYLWGLFAPMHKTKSGEVPTPSVVWDSAKGVWAFHVREKNKANAYNLEGDSRDKLLEQAQTRLSELEPMVARVNEQLAEADGAMQSSLASKIEPIKAELDSSKNAMREAQKARQADLQARAKAIAADDTAAKEKLLEDYRAHLAQIETERESLRSYEEQIDEIHNADFPQRAEAIRAQSAIAEERQYLVKLIDTLENNRQQKLSDIETRLEGFESSYYEASGADLLKHAKSITRTESLMVNAADSEYAKPMTLPDQVLRSVACVFAGFLVASLIAIPVGIVCGLSPIMMSALTPFIALFKPVSPIVWLPIFFIIVGGFIPDPDKHWLIAGLAELPLIGWMKINPAFIASALTVAMCSLWPTLVNTALGVASIDKDHINVARVLRLGFWSRLIKIVIPSSLPLTFAGLRISLGVGWMVLIAAELLSSSEGLGKFVWDMFNNGSSQTFAQMFVVVFVVGIIGLLLDRIMIVFQRLVSFDESPTSI
ncbi:MAG: ABC transporter permease subunit [Opitutales bacterium]|nr:ABC transporter permease subunit [Opitutales bacterium]